ncbi:MAG: hypothetical protein HY527_22865 [Betaproteobacteria bacterium]|nr:hypothetical protein [Betaproteobacteria bacterium]
MKRSHRSLLSAALAVALGAMPPSFVSAEDTDLFVGSPPNADASRPNVLFILDNSANWSAQAQHWTDGSAQGESELRALRNVIGGLKVNSDGTGTINVGLMMFAPGSGQNKDGGYIRYHMREMTATNKLRLQEQLGVDTVDGNGNTVPCVYNATTNLLTGSPNCIKGGFQNPIEQTATADTDYSAALFEAFKYFGGFTDPANANLETQDAHLGNQGASGFGPYRYAGNPEPKSDPAAFVDGGNGQRVQYIPPISAANNCADTYIIFIGNGFPTQDAPSSLLSGVLGNTTQLSMPQVSTTTTVENTIAGQSCGTGANATQRLNNCNSNIPQSLKNANPADSYTCINPVVDAPVCPGANSRKFDVQATKTIISVTFPPGGQSTVPSVNEARFADEWAKYLFTTDVNGSPTDDITSISPAVSQLGAPGQQKVTIFTIDVFKDNQDPRQTRLLYNMAKVSGGEYFQATSEAAIEDALNKALIKIQAKNAVFAAASLPVSATNRAQNENQVFFGMFRPDGVGQPRWYGNLKRYQVAFDANNQLILAGTNTDANGTLVSAVNPLSGFFDSCAVSFWTTDTSDFNTSTDPPTAYWAFLGSAAGQCTTSATNIFSDLPDGPFVEKGGAAEVLRKANDPAADPASFAFSASNRSMYTCSDFASCRGTAAGVATPAIVAFNTTNVSAGRVGASGNSSEHTRIIEYTQGKDVGNVGGLPLGDENVSGSTTDTRPTIHGDVVHSRPLPVNYASTANPTRPVVVYYGGNDGPLRAVRTGDGKELWSFIAPEHHAKLKRLVDNEPIINFPNVPAGTDPTPQRKDFFFDGTMGLFQTIDNSQIWMFPTMRRGGRMIYAFDITNSWEPGVAPVLKWSVGCPNLDNNNGCTTEFADGAIGQTWSTPNVAFIKGFLGGTTPVIVVGGGYDDCEDTDSTIFSQCDSAKGKKVYVINADTGALIRSFSTDRSVAADVALLQREDFDGMVDHAYIVDTGGNLYRIDFSNPSTLAALASNEWNMTKIARTNVTPSNVGRKFLFPPAVLPITVGGASKVILTFGSGDRERPLYTNYPYVTPVPNRFYAFVDLLVADANVATTDNSLAFDLDGVDGGGIPNLVDITTDPLTVCLPDIRGWRMDLVGGTVGGVSEPNGEQVVTSSLISGGRVFFNTHQALTPAVGTCDADLGRARGYSVDLFCGSKFSVIYEGGGLAISPVQGTVTVTGASGTDQTVTFVIGGPGDPTSTNPYTPGQIKPVISPVRSRLYWYRQGDK